MEHRESGVRTYYSPELYVELDQAERVQKLPEPELKELVLGIR